MKLPLGITMSPSGGFMPPTATTVGAWVPGPVRSRPPAPAAWVIERRSEAALDIIRALQDECPAREAPLPMRWGWDEDGELFVAAPQDDAERRAEVAAWLAAPDERRDKRVKWLLSHLTNALEGAGWVRRPK